MEPGEERDVEFACGPCGGAVRGMRRKAPLLLHWWRRNEYNEILFAYLGGIIIIIRGKRVMANLKKKIITLFISFNLSF